MTAHNLASHAAHKLRARREIVEMLKYFGFLALFLTEVLLHSSSDTRFMLGRLVRTQLLEKEFQIPNSSVYKSYLTVDTVDEFHEFLVGPFWFSVFAAGSFDADTSYPEGPLYGARGFLGGANQILGTIRIGQLRVQAQPCAGVIPTANLTQPYCFPDYASDVESKEPFGLTRTYYPSEHESEPTFISVSNRAYPGPTFTVELHNHESDECDVGTKHGCEVYEELEALRSTKFFDAATRAIFVDLSTYSYNADAITVVRLFLEQTMGGGLLATKNVVSFRPYPTTTVSDRIYIAVEVALYLVVLGQAYTALTNLRYDGLSYYRGRGSLTNDVNIVLFFVVAALKMLMFVSLPTSFPADTYINLRTSANYDYLSQSVNSLNCFLSILKVFKYLSFLPTFSILTSTVSSALHELLGLFIMIAILLFGGSMAFTLAFGTSLAHYSVLLHSFYSLMSIFTLKFDVEEIFEVNRVLGPLFFISFVALIVLVIMHMLIACFANAYLEQKESHLLAQTMHASSMGHEIANHLLYHVLFRIPYLGPRVFQPLYQRLAAANSSSSDMAPALQTSTHEFSSSSAMKLVHKPTHPSSAHATGQIVPVNASALEEMNQIDAKNQDVLHLIEELEDAHTALVKDIDRVLEQLAQHKIRHGPEVDRLGNQLDALKKMEDEFEACIASLAAS
ncbi:hypothetical protein SDRG_05111 [Saprolegnia diclina VS20]|uniref:Uncharacterized protein n=1 Tax=Saprolegnia diclina (strain VS20) TaxID=1156394 RepID=T0RY93_SAPDV|nr:hypothetical protein SDRG_05111 [Saprolegnia diclina VS20]EQC37508.1 hypothetical protein SDRG_05111 [Saprolegnia diclina VS20]|eukprot:XP_008609028.1 hypothetical protein SDRG_05111 [Saprolegnia diclina VS20]